MTPFSRTETFTVLNISLAISSVSDASKRLIDLAEKNTSGYVCAPSVHTVMLAQHSPELAQALNNSLMNCPDGRPLSWVGHIKGYSHAEQIRGPDLMLEICKSSVAKELRHFLYGGKSGVAEKLKNGLEERFPGIKIVGTCSPPFRPLDEVETARLRNTLEELRPHFIWVGLGTPKQDLFCAKHARDFGAGIMIAVGAAFDFHSGLLADSPAWVKKAGLQWLHRLIQEPRRLWKRYLLLNPLFIFCVAKELFQNKFSRKRSPRK